MNAVDTNILIYRLDNQDLMKKAKAQALIQQLRQSATPTVLVWQVAGELLRQLRAWQTQKKLSRNGCLAYFAVYRRLFPLVLPTSNVLDRALFLGDRYSLSHWDSMLLGACQEAGVDTLYTEDMGSPTRIDTVQLVNPFV